MREYRLHIAEYNIIVIDDVILDNEHLYFLKIAYYLKQQTEGNNVVPPSIFWNIDVNDILNNRDKLIRMNQKIDVNRSSSEIQEYKRKKTNLNIQRHLATCDVIRKYITPIISKKGLQYYYKKLLHGFHLVRYMSDTNLVTFSSFNDSINAPIIDVENTVQLNASLFYSRFSQKANQLTFNSYTMEQGWVVYNTKSWLDSVVTALNGQLDYLDADTENYYTVETTDKNGEPKNRFTVKTLLQLIKDNEFNT